MDIGVFAWPGVHYSAPAFVSVTFPTHQVRVYGEKNDEDRKLLSVDYSKRPESEYVDPRLFWVADWRDEFGYDEMGKLNEWNRVLPDQTIRYLVDKDSNLVTPPAYRLNVSEFPFQLQMQ